MNIWLDGALEASETLTPGMIAKIEEVFPNLRYSGNTIFIEEQNVGSSGEEKLTGIVEVLREIGVKVEGCATQYGDADGRFEITEDGTVVDLSAEQCAILDAYDWELISELERRGYTVVKNASDGDAEPN